MRNLILTSAAIAIMVSTVGCANGPIRQFLRGAPCSACNPQFNSPQLGAAGGNLISGCSSGTCGASAGTCASGVCSAEPTGSGLLGGLFNRGGSGTTVQNPLPASLPASSFETAPAAITSFPSSGGSSTTGSLGVPAELYGNPNTVGRIELPPSAPFN